MEGGREEGDLLRQTKNPTTGKALLKNLIPSKFKPQQESETER
jgi:hypothetical protein